MIRTLHHAAALLFACILAVPAAAQASARVEAEPGPRRSLLVPVAPTPWKAAPRDGAAAGRALGRSVVYSITGAALGGAAGYRFGSATCDGDPPSAATCIFAFASLGAFIGGVYGWDLGVDRSPYGTRIHATLHF